MSYSVLGADDENLRVSVEDGTVVTLDIVPASLTIVGASGVQSINGQAGDVLLDTDDIPEGGVNLYYTNARVDSYVDSLGLASTDYVDLKVAALVDTAPETLDTLNELAAALGDDPNFATTVSTELGQKFNTADYSTAFDLNLADKNTDDLSEGLSNLYYADSHVDAYLQSGAITDIAFQNTTLTWNPDDGTLEFPVNSEVTLQIGQENVILARNESGSTLPDGTVVRVTGAQGNRLTVDRADNSNDTLSASTIAITTQTIANNNPGYITTQGLVRRLDTSMWAEGSALYLGSNGAMTTVKPLTPLHLVPMGWVVRSHPTEGSIFVNVINGQELEELHDVLITNPTAGQGIVWDAVNGYWKNGDVSVDLTGYATEAYVDASIPTLTSELTNDSGFITGYTESDPVFSASVAAGITTQNVIDWSAAFTWGDHALAGYSTFSGDYNDLINQPSIPADVSDLTDLGGLLLTAEDLYKDADSVLQVNNGAQAKWTFRTTYDAPWDIYNSDLNLQSYGDSSGGLLNFVAYKTTNNNTFLQYNIEDTGTGDDGSHRTTMQLQGGETILAVNSGRLQINAPEIYSENLTLNSGGNPYTLLGGLTTELNVQQSTTPGDYSRLELNAYKTIDLVAWDNFAEPQSNMLRVIKRNIEGGVAAEQSQWNAVQWGSTDGTDFYQIGALGARYDNTLGHETKLQVFDPDTSGLLNNWTVHEHYLYGGKPIWNINYNNTARDALAVTQTGMIIWNTDAGAMQVYDGSQWTALGGGGGGASALNDLTDVEIGGVGNPLTDGDLLRYNGISGTWQNTNLGITLAPVLTTLNTVYANQMVGFEITNWADYGQPSWEVYLVNPDTSETPLTVVSQKPSTSSTAFKSSLIGKALIVYDSGTGTGYLHTIVPNVSGNYKIKIRVQDFGDLPSEYTLHDFTANNLTITPGTYNYVRLTSTRESKTSGIGDPYFTNESIPSGAYIMITELTYWSGAGGTGTESPSVAMTSNTTSSWTASASSVFANSSSYQPWRAFDNNNGGNSWWSFNGTVGTGTDWLQITYGSGAITVGGFAICCTNMSYIPYGFKIEGSDTGAFSGEQSLIFEIDGYAPSGTLEVLI